MEEVISVVIEGSDEISLDTLAGMLMGTSKALKKTAPYSREGISQDFVVKNIEKGSFIITLGTFVSVVATIGISEIPSALSMFVEILKLKEHLMGNDAKKIIHNERGGTVIVVNGDGNPITVNNNTFNGYTSNPAIEKEIQKSMKKLAGDTNVTGLRIENSETRNIEHFDLSKVSKHTDINSLKNTKRSKINVEIITIIKPDFETESRWTGKISGKTIVFKIVDDMFRDRISNYKFTRGTKIKAEVVTEYYVDHSGNVDENVDFKYTVLEVKEVINVDAEQLNIEDIID